MQRKNWRAAFLPGVYQGTYINSAFTDIEKLIEHIKNNSVTLKDQRKQLEAFAATITEENLRTDESLVGKLRRLLGGQ